MEITKTLQDFFKGKSVAIVGFGREGKATLSVLRHDTDCGEIAVLDQNFVDEKECEGCTLYCGENYLNFMGDYDIIVKSPGIALLDKVDNGIKEKITSQTDLLLRFCNHKIIGVTGTKGKSTVSSLVSHILSRCGKNPVLIGNIGIPPLSGYIDWNNKWRPDTVIVCEMSCHQLEFVKASPDTSVLLNIYEEHLDHYVNFNAYKTAKENIFRYQGANDLLIVNKELQQENAYSLPCRQITVSMEKEADIYIDGKDIVFQGKRITYEKLSPKLEGRHNLYNIAAALAAAVENGCELEAAVEAVTDFKGLCHRMEHVRTVNGVKYINDSISTIPNATISAVRTFDADTVIIGGMDRGINYDILIDFLNGGSVTNVICLPDSGYRIADMLKTKSNVFKAKDMEEAVKKAADVSRRCCVLSPAAASYGFYKNFEERGDHFKALVNKL